MTTAAKSSKPVTTKKKGNTGPGNSGPVPTGPPRPRHRLSDVDAEAKTATCSVCGPSTKVSRSHSLSSNWRCDVAKKSYARTYESKKWRKAHPTPRHQHILTEVDEVFRSARCAACGPTEVVSQLNATGNRKWRCWRQRNVSRKSPYQQFKTDTCAWCERKWHRVQLDVDHIDNDHSNNDPKNLQTLCGNCHRLKTWLVAVDVPKELWKAWAAKYQPRASETAH